ncbi:LysR family transcriptional regulator [Paraherbaspirillum soli]|uniref:LysR family transcriptional regulator n=1 Tax=Paraherbaspirillum soli TaxID=631222 RepID=A0ABW0MA92_9BURK
MAVNEFNLNQLRTFVVAADTGSVTATAASVFLSQSSVSEQLKKLEERAGQPLLLRSKQGVALTPAGDKLLAHARRILAMSEAAFEDLQGRGLDGELRIAITDYYRPHDIARILKSFTQLYPRLRLHVTVLKSAMIESTEADNDFDIGLSMRMLPLDGKRAVTSRPPGIVVRREQLVWVTSADVEDVAEGPMPLLVLPATCALQILILKLLDQHKVPYQIAHSASGVAGLQLALSAGLGVSCLNASAIGAGIVACPPEWKLPALPMAEFHLLPPKAGEDALVSNARVALTRLFT